MDPFARIVADPALLEKQILRIAHKHHNVVEFPLYQDITLPASAIRDRAGSFARRISADMKSGRFVPSRPTQSTIYAGKQREIFRFDFPDRVIHGCVADLLGSWIEPVLSENLYSYRPKRGPRDAVRRLAAFVKAARTSERHTDIYGVRRDIAKYGPSVPIGPDSLLWQSLAMLLKSAGKPQETANSVCTFIQELLAECPQDSGLPVGSALVPVLSNVYLADMDRMFSERFPIYARYGDDIFAMSTSQRDCTLAATDLSSYVAARGLHFGKEKAGDIVLHPAGVSSTEGYSGASSCDYLGYSIQWNGSFALSRKHMRAFWSQVNLILKLPLTAILNDSAEERAIFLCQTLNNFLRDVHDLHAESRRVLEVIDDRRLLGMMDYQLALKVAERATGEKGPRAFRKLSYASLRDFGLPSLVLLRNRTSRRKHANGI